MTDGKKFDDEKPRWDLLPWSVVSEIVEVLTFGCKKYSPNNWQLVPNARERYFAAAHRHIAAWRSGEQNDNESNLSHLAHAACCLLFLMWIDGHSIRTIRPKSENQTFKDRTGNHQASSEHPRFPSSIGAER